MVGQLNQSLPKLPPFDLRVLDLLLDVDQPSFTHPLEDPHEVLNLGLPDVQSMHELERLVDFSHEIGAGHVIYSVAKITQRKAAGLPPVMPKMKRVYEHLAGRSLVFDGGSWRLPPRNRHRGRGQSVLGSLPTLFDPGHGVQSESDFHAVSVGAVAVGSGLNAVAVGSGLTDLGVSSGLNAVAVGFGLNATGGWRAVNLCEDPTGLRRTMTSDRTFNAIGGRIG